jgi:hypothetical protein
MRLWADGNEVAGWARYWADVYSYIAEQLERDPELRSMTLLLPYDDLCSSPAEVLERVYRHCALSIEEEVMHEQSRRLCAPTYYDWDFSPGEIETIEREAAGVYDRVRRMAVADR